MENNIIDKGKALVYYNTVIHIIDDNEVEIENCKKILEYDDIFLKLKSSNMIIQVWGKDLKLDDFNNEGVRIRGKISSVEVSRIKKNANKE